MHQGLDRSQNSRTRQPRLSRARCKLTTKQLVKNWQIFFAKKVSTFVQGQPLKVPNYICTYVRTLINIHTYVCNFTIFVSHIASQYVRRALTFLLLVPHTHTDTHTHRYCLYVHYVDFTYTVVAVTVTVYNKVQ